MYRNGLNSGRDAVNVKAMKIPRYKSGRNYMNAYHSHFPISPPEEDLDARLALYSLGRDLSISIVDRLGLLFILRRAKGRSSVVSPANHVPHLPARKHTFPVRLKI